MLISRNWLQSYTTTELPRVEDIAQTLLVHSFEIEGVHTLDTDEVIDIDVLPNRAHDCLSHKGVAHELLGLLDLSFVEQRYPKLSLNPSLDSVVVNIDDTRCRRYAATYMSNVKVAESPTWIKEYLKSINQKSINNIVDATNYVMFDLGQPLHTFDADKVVGTITIRMAREGETMTTLSSEELILSTDDLVVADDEGVLALAGIKGGTRAEVTSLTTNIIIEAANFDPRSVRMSSRRMKLQTDSSKRFENELCEESVSDALPAILALVHELASTNSTQISSTTDLYPSKAVQKNISLDRNYVTKVLGCDISKDEITNLLEKFSFDHSWNSEILTLTVPYSRLDLNEPCDIVEEIGRWYGYHNIPSAPVSELSFFPELDALSYIINSLKNTLINLGYTELLTYSFVKKGKVKLWNPMGSDKQSLRSNLFKQLNDAVERNVRNASYFGLHTIKSFEIGRVYGSEGEQNICTVSCVNVDKKGKKLNGDEVTQLNIVKEALTSQFAGISFEDHDHSFSCIIDTSWLGDIDSYGTVFDEVSYDTEAKFKPISIYPYSTRDISLWVEEGVQADEVLECIKEQAGEFLVKSFMFDKFSKEGRTSYAFSLVFQSHERTLEDVDIDTAMESIISEMKNRAWEVR